jgi:nicotinamide mononucleotide transporter
VSEYLTPLKIIEALGAVFSIVYSLLLMREKKAGWIFGIVSSILGVILFYEKKIYAQSMISIYYAGIGLYGWYYWAKAEKRNEHIHKWTVKRHVQFIGVFAILSLICGYFFDQYTDSPSPYLDSYVTVFGFLASIKEARKILTSWLYWLVINSFSVWLYWGQNLDIWGALMILYAVICIPGYLSWLKIYKENKPKVTLA